MSAEFGMDDIDPDVVRGVLRDRFGYSDVTDEDIMEIIQRAAEPSDTALPPPTDGPAMSKEGDPAGPSDDGARPTEGEASSNVKNMPNAPVTLVAPDKVPQEQQEMDTPPFQSYHHEHSRKTDPVECASITDNFGDDEDAFAKRIGASKETEGTASSVPATTMPHPTNEPSDDALDTVEAIRQQYLKQNAQRRRENQLAGPTRIAVDGEPAGEPEAVPPVVRPRATLYEQYRRDAAMAVGEGRKPYVHQERFAPFVELEKQLTSGEPLPGQHPATKLRPQSSQRANTSQSRGNPTRGGKERHQLCEDQERCVPSCAAGAPVTSRLHLLHSQRCECNLLFHGRPIVRHCNTQNCCPEAQARRPGQTRRRNAIFVVTRPLSHPAHAPRGTMASPMQHAQLGPKSVKGHF